MKDTRRQLIAKDGILTLRYSQIRQLNMEVLRGLQTQYIAGQLPHLATKLSLVTVQLQ